MLDRLFFGVFMTAVIVGWLAVALLAWALIFHPLISAAAALAIFGVYMARRRRGTLAGPRH